MCPRILPLCGLLAALSLGCGGEKKTAVAPSPRTTAPPPVTITSAPMLETMPVSPSISVSEEIARACRLHFSDLSTAPKFEFDKSDLLPADHEILGKIGQCVTTGPLEGRSLMLVGRADPRGTTEYNMALGARRAHNVSLFLEQLGVTPQRIKETSRGELDAVGTDEATWQIDRRVDILLAE